MSKTATGRFPSVRNNLTYQRKQSKELTMLSKEELPHTYAEGDKKHQTQTITTQNQIAKKIQSKLRMRKPSDSEKKLSQTISGKNIEQVSSSQSQRAGDMHDQIDAMWENSHQIFQILQSTSLKINQQAMKEQLMKESSVLRCRLAKGEDLERILVEKLRRKIEKAKCIRSCEEKENSVKSMFDSRLQQLNMILKTR